MFNYNLYKKTLTAFFFIVAIHMISIEQMEAREELIHGNITAENFGIIMNVAGKQRMLTQKMTKEVLLITIGINENRNIINLQNSVELFKKTLAGLKNGDSSLNLTAINNQEIRKQLDFVKSLFEELEPIFFKVINKSKLSQEELYFLREKNIPLLLAMNKAVKMFERAYHIELSNHSSIEVVINLAGKQRMLTQKMFKEYLCITLGLDIEANKMSLRETIGVFSKILNGLQMGDSDLGLPQTNDENIRKQLNITQKLWVRFKTEIDKIFNVTNNERTKDDINKIAEMNIKLLINMDKAVKMYEGLTY